MNTIKLQAWTIALTVALGLSLTPGALAAQDASDVIIAIPDEFPELNGGAVALVITEASRSVVLLRKNRAAPSVLAAAMQFVKAGRGLNVPDGQSALHVITGVVAKSELKKDRDRDLRRVITAIRRAPKTSLGDYGDGRWVLWSGSSVP